MSDSQTSSPSYQEFLAENRASLRYALSQQVALGKIKNKDGLDVVLELLGSLQKAKIPAPTVGRLLLEYRTYGPGSQNNTDSLLFLLSNALGCEKNLVTTSNTTPLDLIPIHFQKNTNKCIVSL